jgi:hypothetical protein
LDEVAERGKQGEQGEQGREKMAGEKMGKLAAGVEMEKVTEMA